jgi:hypothetical protein
MTASTRVRRLGLTLHVVCAVGWLGGVGLALALAGTALLSDDESTVRSALIALDASGWWYLLPLSVASLGTGVVQSLITKWGLLNHYWIVAKLAINVFAAGILLLYMQSLGHYASLARSTATSLADLRDPSPLIHTVGALALLVGATALSIYKPPGLTRRGHRVRQESAGLTPRG